jgi:aspartate carbamoyltransferase catalytic subunit
MGLLETYADEHDLIMLIRVRRFGSTDGMTNEQLVDFYKTFGFQPNGHIYGDPVMVRHPNPKETHEEVPQASTPA